MNQTIPHPELIEDTDLDHVESVWKEDLETLALFNLLRTNSYLAPMMELDYRRLSLTSAQFNTLLVLRRAGEAGLKMSDLGDRLVVTKANMTGLVDRLQKQGWVHRFHLKDRRVSWVTLTDIGHAKLAEVTRELPERIAPIMEGLSEEEKLTLISLLGKLRRSWRKSKQKAITL